MLLIGIGIVDNIDMDIYDIIDIVDIIDIIDVIGIDCYAYY